MSGNGNYLTRLAGPELRKHPRRPCNCPGKVYYLRKGVRGYTAQPCRMLNLSESGCLIETPVMSQVPDHLYLVLDGLEMKFSAGVVTRSEAGLHLQFGVELPTKLVDQLSRRRFVPGSREGRQASAGAA